MPSLLTILPRLLAAGALLTLTACAETASVSTSARAPSKGGLASLVASKPPSPPGAGIRAERIPVTYCNAKQLASMLRDVLDLEGPRSGPIRAILVDEGSGDLVVVGTDEGIAAAHRLLRPDGQPPVESSSGIEVVPLQHATAAEVANVVRPTVGPDVKVIPDAPTNSIVLQALAEERGRLRRVIAALDVEPKAR